VLQPPPAATLGHHVRRTLVLAGPMILTRVGLVLMSTVDVVVLGRAGAEELAAYVLGQAIYDSLIAVTVGLLLGVPVLVAREAGAGRNAMAGVVWRRGLVFAAFLGALLCLALQFAGIVFRATGQEPALAARAAEVSAVLGFALPSLALYYTSAAFLEALHRPGVAFVSVLAGNVVNLGLNVVLVFGVGPVPPLGAVGAAIATVVTFTLLALGIALYILFAFPARARYGVVAPPAVASTRPFEQIRIGLAAGVSFGFEAGAFTVMTLFIGWLGTIALAAHGVLFQYLALTFMVAYGIAGATQVRVGNAWGREDPRGMATAGWTGLGLAVALTGSAGLLYLAFPEPFLAVFTDDPAVIAGALPVFLWVALALVFDGGQTVMSNACRGRGDTWVPTALHFGSYWLVMVPAAWAFAFAAGNGLAGIYQGILVASMVSLGVLALRFAALTRGRP
jgi:multidrug resistance protein, MATE family